MQFLGNAEIVIIITSAVSKILKKADMKNF